MSRQQRVDHRLETKNKKTMKGIFSVFILTVDGVASRRVTTQANEDRWCNAD
jgi:hypothetical protein